MKGQALLAAASAAYNYDRFLKMFQRTRAGWRRKSYDVSKPPVNGAKECRRRRRQLRLGEYA